MKITLLENGPILVKVETGGSLRLGADDETRSDTLALCRCGQSKNKPFCDGSHYDAGFKHG